MFTGARVMMGAATLLVCWGCGNNSQQKEGPKTYAELSAAIADRSCRSRAACCASEGFDLDLPACVKAGTARFVAHDESNSEAGVEYDAAIGVDCLHDMESLLVCGEADDAGRTLSACTQLFHARKQPGEPCEDGSECAHGVGQSATCSSDYLAEGSPGVCVLYTQKPARHAAAGDACDHSCPFATCIVDVDRVPAAPEPRGDVACFRSDGLYCNPDQVCAPLLEAGGVCVNDEECAPAFYCQPTTGTSTGACMERPEKGSDCFNAPLRCASGYCDEESWQCADPPAFDPAECATSG